MPDSEPTPDPIPDPAPTPDPTPARDPEPAPLGPGGEAALKAERKRADAAEKAQKALQKQIDDLAAATATESEKAIAAARKEGGDEATTKANARIIAAEVKAAAAGKLANPADALALIDLTDITVSDDGEVDTEAISAAITSLLEAKPYLAGAKPAATPSVPTGTQSGGKPPTLDEQIAEAHKAGDIARVIHLQNQKLAPAGP